MLYFFVDLEGKYSMGWEPPIGVCRSEMELQRPNLTNFDAFFCKKSMFRWIWEKTFFFGTKFSFFGDQGDLFRRLHHISTEGVPISREGVLIALLYGMIRD